MTLIGRRSFLLGSTAILSSHFLMGCASSKQNFQVLLLEGSIPALLIRSFVKQVKSPAKLNFKSERQLQKLFDLLLAWEQAQTTKFSRKWPLFPNGSYPQRADLVSFLIILELI